MSQNSLRPDEEMTLVLPRPKFGERLFRSDLPDVQNNARPGAFADPGNWGLITEGYLHAADALIECLLSKSVSVCADEIVYPVCFLFRQYIELRLKHVISLGHRWLQGRFSAPKGHKLDCLWQQARPVLCNVCNIPTELLDTIEYQILELHRIDPGSDEFRYPKKNDGTVALDSLKMVNLRHMRDVMAAMDAVLGGAVMYLDEAINGSNLK